MVLCGLNLSCLTCELYLYWVDRWHDSAICKVRGLAATTKGCSNLHINGSTAYWGCGHHSPICGMGGVNKTLISRDEVISVHVWLSEWCVVGLCAQRSSEWCARGYKKLYVFTQVVHMGALREASFLFLVYYTGTAVFYE